MIGIILLLCIFSKKAYCQSEDSLSLQIKGLAPSQIILKKFGKDTIVFTPMQNNLSVSSNSWIFKITTELNVFVVIKNLEGDGRLADTLRDFNRNFTIQNNTIVGDSFLLKKNFNIEIYDNATKARIKFFQIDYNPISTKAYSNSIVDYNVGSAVFDALTLASNASDVLKLKILKFYAKDSSNLEAEYQKNEFLDSMAKKLAGVRKSEGNFGLSSMFSSIGGLDVTTIADGFAKFIVKRTKKELNNAFFEKFKEFINKYPDLQSVFPQTYRALSIIGDEIYNYEAYIQTLRESFENDLSTLDKNLPSIIENHPDFFHRHRELAAMLNSGCYIAGALDDKIHPGDILKDYPDNYLDSINVNWKGAIQTLQLISASLRDTATKTDSVYWVSTKQVKTLINTKGAFKIYLGLIYQQAKNNYESIHFNFKGNDTTFTGIINELHGHQQDISAYQDFVTHFIEKANKLDKMVKNYKKSENDSLAFAQYYAYFNSSVNLLQHCTEISKLPYLKEKIPDLQESLKDYFEVAHSAADLVLDVKRRNYSSAVVNAVHIYDLVKAKYPEKTTTASAKTIKKAKDKLQTDVEDLIKQAQSNPDKSFTAADIDSLKKTAEIKIESEQNIKSTSRQNKKMNSDLAKELIENTPNDKSLVINKQVLDSLRAVTTVVTTSKKDDVLKKFYKYGTFMAAVVQAKTSDDVENVIEAFALPTGSSKIKRVSDFNVSINSYAGLFYGFERINSVDSGKWQANVYGVTAPIGVAASWGHRLFFVSTGKKEWSTSVFISLIDLGAVAAFRFRDDSTAQVPTIELRDIFSPGAFLSIGIPKTPLSVNVGAQVGPNLRKINTQDPAKLLNDYSTKMYWRYSVSVCVDLPLLNLYSKSK